MSRKIDLDIKKLVSFEVGEIEDREMVRSDFKKALLITFLALISAGILSTAFFFI